LIEAGTGGSPARAQLAGMVTGMSGLTPGANYFVDAATAGVITATMPTEGYVQYIGKAITTTTLWLMPTPLVRGVSALHFMYTDIPGTQGAATWVPLIDNPDFPEALIPYDGAVIAISAVVQGVVTGGTATFEAYINGAGTGFTVALSTGVSSNHAHQAATADPFNHGDTLGVKFTSSGWLPAGRHVVVSLWFETLGEV